MYRGNRGLTKEYERERGEYNRAKKEMLKQHTKDFWEEQTRVENEWLEDFIKTQKEKKIRDDAKLRNSIIMNSFICYENIVNCLILLII
jgi:predicted acetyltransferase